MFEFVFDVALFFGDVEGLDKFPLRVYAKNNYSAYQALFKALGPLRYNLVSVTICYNTRDGK